MPRAPPTRAPFSTARRLRRTTTLAALMLSGLAAHAAPFMPPPPSASPGSPNFPYALVLGPGGQQQVVPLLGARNKIEAVTGGIADTAADVAKGLVHCMYLWLSFQAF